MSDSRNTEFELRELCILLHADDIGSFLDMIRSGCHSLEDNPLKSYLMKWCELVEQQEVDDLENPTA